MLYMSYIVFRQYNSRTEADFMKGQMYKLYL